MMSNRLKPAISMAGFFMLTMLAVLPAILAKKKYLAVK